MSGRDADPRYAGLWPAVADALWTGGGPRVVVEAGAAEGTDTEHIYGLASLYGAPTYLAFEPDPRNYEKLVRRVASVTAIQRALSWEEGEATLRMSRGEHDGRSWERSSSLRAPKQHVEKFPWVTFDEKVTVKTVTLDAECARRGVDHVDFMWMDAQGSEGDAIAGGHKILTRTRYLYVEVEREEMFAGQLVGVDAFLTVLGPDWVVVREFPFDVLFFNSAVEAAS